MYEYLGEDKNYEVVGSFASDRNTDFKASTKHLFESCRSTFNLDAAADISRILGLDTIKESYKDMLLDDVTEAAFDDPYYAMLPKKLEQLFENTADVMLQESSVAQLNPIVGITLPVLKKSYIEGHSKDIVMTEVPTKPIIKAAFERRFLKDEVGNKHYIPDIFYNDAYKDILDQGRGKAVSNAFYPKDAEDGTAGTLPIQDLDILAESGGSITSRDSLDHDFHIASVTMSIDGTVYTVPNLHISPNMGADSTFYARIKAPVANAEGVVLEDSIVGKVDFYWGKVTVASTAGLIQKVQFGGHLSNQNNTRTIELDRERETLEWKIGEGVHLNTGLTVEKIKDYKALFDLDITAEVISDMSTVLSQMEDSDILGYVSNRYDQMAQADSMLQRFGYTDGFTRTAEFSCEPGANKYVTQSQYIESELKYNLNRFIDELKILLKTSDLMFVVYGHPNNITLIQDNVRWVIEEDTKIGGIQLDYRFGVMTANKNRIHVISTLKCPKSRGLRVVAYPLSKEVITFKHYKYALNIENGYRNPLTPLTPNVMATSRYKTVDVLPVQGEFHLIDNNFAMQYPDATPAQPVLAMGETNIEVQATDFPNGYGVTASSTTPGATLYYTVDGSIPSAASTQVPATGIITVTSSATVKVVAVKTAADGTTSMSAVSSVNITIE